MIPPKTNDVEAQVILDSLLSEEDPEALKVVIMELVVATGFWYRRAQMSRYLHPLFFLGGFITCYFIVL